MAPSSQSVELAQNPGRFTLHAVKLARKLYLDGIQTFRGLRASSLGEPLLRQYSAFLKI
jgi:hypothetical protein